MAKNKEEFDEKTRCKTDVKPDAHLEVKKAEPIVEKPPQPAQPLLQLNQPKTTPSIKFEIGPDTDTELSPSIGNSSSSNQRTRSSKNGAQQFDKMLGRPC